MTTAWGDSTARGEHGAMCHMSSACMESAKKAGIVARPPTLHTVFTLACQYRLKLLWAVQVWAWPCIASILGVPMGYLWGASKGHPLLLPVPVQLS
eukprot:1100115-Prymnesium_polylepis.1